MKMDDIKRNWRISLDESYFIEKDTESRREKWRYYEIRGKLGMIYPFSEDSLSVYVSSPMIAGRIKRARKWKILQDAEKETTFLAHISELDHFAKLIRAKRRRHLTGEQRERVVKMGLANFKRMGKI